MTQTVEHYLRVLWQGFVPIFVADAFDAVALAEASVAAGANVVEITCRRSDVRDDIRRVVRQFPDLTVLVGSVVDDGRLLTHLRLRRPDFPSLDELADLGVHGFVSALPLSERSIARLAGGHVMIPGVETAWEAVRVLEAGAHFAKLFYVAGTGEAGRIRILASAPFHGLLPLFVTGGVTLDKIEPYTLAGAAVLGSGWDVLMGSNYQAAQANPKLAELTQALSPFLTRSHDVRKQVGSPTLDTDDRRLLDTLPFVHPFSECITTATAADR